MRATGFDNYYKIPVRDHVCGTKFWHIHVRVQIYIYKKRYQVSKLLPSDFSNNLS